MIRGRYEIYQPHLQLSDWSIHTSHGTIIDLVLISYLYTECC